MEPTKQVNKEMWKYMLKFALVGAIGFGIGNYIGWDAGILIDSPHHESYSQYGFLIGFIKLSIGFMMSGVVGGFALGLVFKDVKKALLFAFVIAFGMCIGFMTRCVDTAYYNIIAGIIGAFALGLIFKDIKKIILVTFGGMVGIVVGNIIVSDCIIFDAYGYCLFRVILNPMVVYGLIIGLTVGYLKYKDVLKNG